MSGRRVGIKEASELLGLSQHALRMGCKRGLFPYFKVGLGKGRIILDLEMLDEAIATQMMENQANAKMAAAKPETFYPGIRKINEK